MKTENCAAHNGLLALTILLLLMVEQATALQASGTIKGSSSWEFLEKYIFATGHGTINFEALFPYSQSPVLAFYYLDGRQGVNEFDLWKNTVNGQLTCTEKLDAADLATKLSAYESGIVSYAVETIDSHAYVRLKANYTFSTQRLRYFMAAVGSCVYGDEVCGSYGCADSIEMEWSLHFLNGDGFFQELSAPDYSMFVVSLSLFCVYSFFIIMFWIPVIQKLIANVKLHATVMFLFIATAMQMASLFLHWVYYLGTAMNGTPRWRILLLSDFAHVASESLMLLLCNVLAKGWTITVRKISAKGRVKIMIFYIVYLSASSLSVLYYDVYVPKDDVSYVYDSKAGLTLLLMRLLAFIWIQRAVEITIRKYKEKVRFFSKFRRLSGIWLLNTPFMVGCLLAVAPYLRSSIVHIIDAIVLMVFQFGLAALYNPDGYFASSFPFHTTTTMMMMPASKRPAQTQASLLNQHVQRALNYSSMLINDMLVFLSEVDPGEEALVRNDEDLYLPEEDKSTQNKLFDKKPFLH